MPFAAVSIRFFAREGSVRSLWGLLQALPLLLTLLAFGADARAQGSWTSYDWSCDTANLTPPTDQRVRIMHGALIPHGPYRGWVMTWGKYQDATRTFLWDPSNPARLFHVVNTWAGADRDMEGVSMTWDDEGQLVVIGPSTYVGTPGSETWRVFPGSLGYPPMQTVPSTPCASQAATVGGNAWRAAPSMSVTRYRATILALAKGSLGTSAASASTFVLGGLNSSIANDGWEFWQALSPRSTPGGSAWNSTLVPNITHPHTNPISNQQYLVQGGLAETQVEATPGAVQLATSGLGLLQFEKSIVVSLDSLVTYSSPPITSNSSGRTTLVRPAYATAQNPSWELHPGSSLSFDRSQGSVVLRHDLGGGLPGFDGRNRVITFGGMTYDSQSAGWFEPLVPTEYEIATNAPPTSGQWATKVFPSVSNFTPVGHIDNSAVVLPTGDIFVVGGGSITPGAVLSGQTPSTLPLTPNNQPQLVRPARAGQSGSTWSAINTAPAPVSPTLRSVAPRVHGHAAVLLADGRVLVTGGEQTMFGSAALSGSSGSCVGSA